MKKDQTQRHHRAFVWVATGLSALMLACVLTACANTPPPAPEVKQSVAHVPGVAGGMFSNTIKLYAKVVSIDSDNRTVKLMNSEGKKFDVTVGPEAVNFDQIRSGDMVQVTVTEELIVSVNTEGTVVTDASAGVVASAAKGEKPGAIVAGSHLVTAKIAAIDTKARTAKLTFMDGKTETFAVRDDVDMSRYKVGQQVVFQLTQIVAINVVKPKASEE